MSKARTSIHLGRYRDETSRLCTWHVPQTHFLEAWDDSFTYGRDLAYGIAQPLIEPLYGGKSAIEVLALILGKEAARSGGMVRESFKELYESLRGPQLEEKWRQMLRNGTRPDMTEPGDEEQTAPAGERRQPPPVAPPKGEPPTIPAPAIKNGDLEIIFLPDAKVYDGRFANNGWLQELPDPITSLTWDNAAMMSPATAKVLGVKSEDVVG